MTLQLLLDGELAFADESEGEAAEGAEEEAEDPPNPVIPVGNELLWAALCFFSLWALMKYVLLPPILGRRSEREAAIRADKDAAERAHDDLAKSQMDYDDALMGARAEANAAIDAARAEADEYRSRIQAEADAEIAAQRAEATAEIERAREAALGGMRDDVGDLAVQAASLVVEEPIDASAQQSVIDRALGGES